MTPRKKITIIIIIGAAIWIGIALFIVWLTQRSQNSENQSDSASRIVIIDNASQYKNNGLSDSFLSIIESAVYTTLQNNVSRAANVYHGTIRDGSFEEQAAGGVSFLLDIPSIKLSWYVVQGQSDPSVSCATQSQAIWPLPSKCVNLSTILSKESSNGTPTLGGISQYLPISDVSYTMDSGYSPTNSKELAILVTCYAVTCQQDVTAQIQSLGFNPANYQIVYTKAY